MRPQIQLRCKAPGCESNGFLLSRISLYQMPGENETTNQPQNQTNTKPQASKTLAVAALLAAMKKKHENITFSKPAASPSLSANLCGENGGPEPPELCASIGSIQLMTAKAMSFSNVTSIYVASRRSNAFGSHGLQRTFEATHKPLEKGVAR